MIAAVEGILFLRGDEGITKEELAKILNLSEEELQAIISEIKIACQCEKRGIKLAEYGDILKYVTKKGHEDIYRQLVMEEASKPLTQASLEVLAIIAYNQPITRLEIDELRGVASAHLIRRLLVKELIYEAGRGETPGRPIIYRTTSQFLDALGINDLSQLPSINEFEELAEVELFSEQK